MTRPPFPRRILALLLISAALADDTIHPREEKLIVLGVGREIYQEALLEFVSATTEQRDRIREEIGAHLEERHAREKALELIKEMFLADGKYDPEEAEWMDEVWPVLQSESTE